MIDLERIPKDLEITPLIFGIKGRYVMLLVLLVVVTIILTLVGAVVLFFHKKIGFSILIFFLGLGLIIGEVVFFQFISNKKKFADLEKGNNIVSNYDLKKYLE